MPSTSSVYCAACDPAASTTMIANVVIGPSVSSSFVPRIHSQITLNARWIQSPCGSAELTRRQGCPSNASELIVNGSAEVRPVLTAIVMKIASAHTPLTTGKAGNLDSDGAARTRR